MNMCINSDSFLPILHYIHVDHGYLHPNTRIRHQFLLCSRYSLLQYHLAHLDDVFGLPLVEVALVDHLY